MLSKKTISKLQLQRYDAVGFDYLHILRGGMKRPFVVVGQSEDFGLALPRPDFSMKDVARCIGETTKVRLIEGERTLKVL